MSDRRFDTLLLDDVRLPYDRISAELRPSIRIVEGQNVYVDSGGKIRKRPAIRNDVIGSFVVPANKRIDVLKLYETVEDSPKRFILASMFDSVSSNWAMYWIRLDDVTPAWTSMGSLRSLNASTRAHEIVTAQGLAFIKGFPVNAAADPLGSVIFDGTDQSTTFWGLLAPGTAAAPTASAGWGASSGTVDVKWGWRYAYAFVTKNDHISSRSPVGTKPTTATKPSDSTGAFTNKIPQVTLTGNADTTNIPTIRVYRTTDGGGNFLFLEDVTNPGAGNFTYTDDSDGGDPKTDFDLDTGQFAPSLFSNDPPPTIVSPQVVGTDNPRPTTPVVEFANRLWFGIENILFFSGQEEIIEGSPWEAFPSGIRGNFFRLKDRIRNLLATDEALFVVTADRVLRITGTNRQNLFARILIEEIGGPREEPRSITAIGRNLVWVTNDFDLAIIGPESQQPQILSGPLGDDLLSLLNANTEIHLVAHIEDARRWIVLGLKDKATSANSRIWVLDIDGQQWNPPWVIPFTAMVSGRLDESNTKKKLVIATTDGSAAKVGVLDPDAETDQIAGGDVNFALDFTTNLFTVPAGNHVNLLRRPAHVGSLAYLILERTKFGGDTDPTVEFRLDDFAGSFTAAMGVDPPQRDQSTSFIQKWYPIQEATHRVQMKVSKTSSAEKFELQTIGFVFQPDA